MAPETTPERAPNIPPEMVTEVPPEMVPEMVLQSSEDTYYPPVHEAWQMGQDDNGYTYYYNHLTGVSAWQLPEGHPRRGSFGQPNRG